NTQTSQAASLTMTQTSPTNLNFAIDIPSLSLAYTAALTVTNQNTVQGFSGQVFNFADGALPNNEWGAIVWQDPDNPPGLYNIMTIEPNRNLQTTTFTIYVDQDAAGVTLHTDTWCRSGGPFAPCPVLANGQTITVPIWAESGDAGPIDVTYRDLVATPLPGA